MNGALFLVPSLWSFPSVCFNAVALNLMLFSFCFTVLYFISLLFIINLLFLVIRVRKGMGPDGRGGAKTLGRV